jgi:hypothetical protein
MERHEHHGGLHAAPTHRHRESHRSRRPCDPTRDGGQVTLEIPGGSGHPVGEFCPRKPQLKVTAASVATASTSGESHTVQPRKSTSIFDCLSPPVPSTPLVQRLLFGALTSPGDDVAVAPSQVTAAAPPAATGTAISCGDRHGHGPRRRSPETGSATDEAMRSTWFSDRRPALCPEGDRRLPGTRPSFPWHRTSPARPPLRALSCSSGYAILGP